MSENPITVRCRKCGGRKTLIDPSRGLWDCDACGGTGTVPPAFVDLIDAIFRYRQPGPYSPRCGDEELNAIAAAVFAQLSSKSTPHARATAQIAP
jgi:hypothetical protein